MDRKNNLDKYNRARDNQLNMAQLKKERARVSITTRVEPSTKKGLQQLAKEDHRKTADYARKVLREHVDKAREEGKIR